jgi:alkanesulfonate monooxygenase SsuD/methylene tetrahydromethanopterin reductase-like flavin-dependent oxidoreductase (luciferase family)
VSSAAPALELSQWVITSVAADRALARSRARQSLAFYLSTPSYAGQFAGTRWQPVPGEVIAAFRRVGPAWDQLGELVPDAMIDDYCLAGTPAEVADQFLALQEELGQNGVGEVVLQVAVPELDEEQTAAAVTDALHALGTCR